MTEAMAAQVDALDPLEPFRPWLRRDLPPFDAAIGRDSTAAITTLIHVNDVLSQPEQLPPCPRTHHDTHSQALDSSATSVLPPPPPVSDEPRDLIGTLAHDSGKASAPDEADPAAKTAAPGSGRPDATSEMPALRLIAPTRTDAFAFPPAADRPKTLPPSLKRRRSIDNVDGPHTASMCCKKRRLRRYLITSRLSQPFSLPATHILNRESAASGDMRFLKLAAITNARRIVLLPLPPPSPANTGTSGTPTHPPKATLVPVPHPPGPGEMLRRIAMANCMRKRAVADAAAGKRVGMPMPLMASARFAQMPASASMAATAPTAAATAFFPNAVRPPMRPGPSLAVSSSTFQPPRPVFRPAMPAPPTPPGAVPPGQLYPMNRMAPFVRNSVLGGVATPVLPRPLHSPKPGPLRSENSSIPEEASLPLDPPEPTPETKIGSELRYGNDDDDDGCAFPSIEHESYDASDDPDEVYSDFSVLFSASSDDAEFNEDGYDDYMDELDGIAHLPRAD